MPGSHPMIISPIMMEFIKHHPKTILDIGIGTGKFGALMREYSENWNETCLRLRRGDWTTTIHGIEIFPVYKSPLWDFYNTVMIGDAVELIETLPNYDLILMAEVLEHLPKEVGKRMLAKCAEKSDTFIFSFTNCYQGAIFNNENERHVSQWKESDLGIKATLLFTGGWSSVYVAQK